jgi:hypothetical protein
LSHYIIKCLGTILTGRYNKLLHMIFFFKANIVIAIIL